MKALYSSKFKSKLKLIARGNRELAMEIGEVVQLLLDDPNNPGLRVHKLSGDHDEHFSASVGENIRIIFYYMGGNIVLVNIGTHEEVYRMN